MASLLPLLALLGACSGYTRSSKVNISQSYTQRSDRPNIGLRVHVLDDSTGILFARMPASWPAGAGQVPVLEWILSKDYNNHPLDTGTFWHRHTYTSASGTVIYDTLSLDGQGEYNLHLTFLPSGGKEFMYFKSFSIESWGSAMSVLPMSMSGDILFSDYSLAGEGIRITLPGKRSPAGLKVNYFRHEYNIAAPPFTTSTSRQFRYRPDSSFYLSSDILVPRMSGIYHILLDTATNSGFALPVFDPDFPYVSSPTQMVKTTRYLMTKKEYDLCVEAADKKQAIDAFWIEVSGNTNRARKQMALYYRNVQYANTLFSSYSEGWSTDRGMIYIVLGPPDMVYRSSLTETWVYGEQGFSRSLTLVFKRIDDPFTREHYHLERLPTYKDSWYIAVNNWRR